jgi:hypothetical protein
MKSTILSLCVLIALLLLPQPGSAKHRAILKYDQFTTSIMDEEGTSIYQ